MEVVQRLKDLLSVVCKVRVSGAIDSALVMKVTKELESVKWRKVQALAIVVNSPGGSAAQSSILRQRVQAFGAKFHCPVFAFAEDIAASGGYYVMTAAQELFVTPGSLVGSIGAVTRLLSVKDFATRQGIERRSWSTSAFSLEDRVDPLREIRPEVVKWAQRVLEETHLEFKTVVQAARKDKLLEDAKQLEEKVFNADVFQASQALELGLVDRYGYVDEVLKQRFPQYKVIDLSKTSPRQVLKQRLLAS
jgi:signal peptide peptidase SppA